MYMYVCMHVCVCQVCVCVRAYVCVAVCCSVLQCAAVCHSALQYVAVCCNALQCVAVCCSVLPCVAVYCSVLQCVAVCCSVIFPQPSSCLQLVSSHLFIIHPIADRVAQNLEFISKTFSTNQTSAHGIHE